MKILPVTVIDRTRGVPIISRVGFALMAIVLLGIILGAPTPAYAGGCSDNADCAPGYTCVVTWNLWLYKIRECQRTRCNADSDCTRGTWCIDGVCGGVPQPSHPAPGHIPGEGRRCTPPNGPNATDSHGKPLPACPEGLVCSDKGFCIKPLQ